MTSIPTHITKYDAVRTVLYTTSGGWRRARSLWHRPYLFRPTIYTAWTRYRQFFRGLWRSVRPVLWSGAKSLGREALRTGGNIMTEIAANPGQTGDILSKHATETTQNIIKKLRGGGRKRKRAFSPNRVSRTRELESRNVRPPPRL